MARNSDREVHFVDLFSGCGGFSCGLELAGMTCSLGVDFNAHAMKTFAANHHRAALFQGPIEQLTNTQLDQLLGAKQIDLVVGGPPCQGFSTVGRGDAGDDRNSLFKHFVRIVKHLQPSLFIMENVTGLLATKNESHLKKIFKLFSAQGYELDARILDAHQFGVPSARRRAFILGSRLGAPHCFFPDQTQSSQLTPVTVAQAWERGLIAPDGQLYNHQVKAAALKDPVMRKRLSYIPAGQGIRYAADQEKFLPKKWWFDVDFASMREGRFRQKKLQRLDWQAPAPTLMTDKTYFHPKEHRHLTVRETAALQSFPSDFIFHGPLSSQYQQIGNSVPPLLAKAFGLQILSELKRVNPKAHLEKQKTIKKVALPELLKKIRSKAFVYKKSNNQGNLEEVSTT